MLRYPYANAHISAQDRTRLLVMRIVVIGTDLPGRTFCEPDSTPLGNVHVGVQIRTEPEQLARSPV
jgi:hypothetical protein